MTDKEYLKAMGARIRAFRHNKGYSLMKLASMCEIELGTVQRIERGFVNARLLTLKRIAKELTVELNDIV